MDDLLAFEDGDEDEEEEGKTDASGVDDGDETPKRSGSSPTFSAQDDSKDKAKLPLHPAAGASTHDTRKASDVDIKTATKTSMAMSKRDLPTGVYIEPSTGKFKSMITWGKYRSIGTFDTPEQASAAYLSVRKDREDADLSSRGADEVNALFDAAKKKAVDAVGGISPSNKRAKAASERDLNKTKDDRRQKMYSNYIGVTYNKTHAKYQACITHYRKQHYLGRYKLAVDAARAYDESAKLLKGSGWRINFGTIEEYELAKKQELEHITSKERAEEEAAADGVSGSRKKKVTARDLAHIAVKIQVPSSVFKVVSEANGEDAARQAQKIIAEANQATIERVKMQKENSESPATEADAIIDAAKKKASGAVDRFVPKKRAKATSERDLPQGVYKTSTGKFTSMIWWDGKLRDIGTFDTPEQASAAYMSAKRDLEDAKLSALGADYINAIFDAAQKKAVEAVGGTSVTIRRSRSSFHSATDEEKAKAVNAYLSRKEKGEAI